MWSEASTASIVTSHALSISWLLTMLYVARSKRARGTFNTGLEGQRSADQVFRQGSTETCRSHSSRVRLRDNV